MNRDVYLIIACLMLLSCSFCRAEVPGQSKQEFALWSSVSFNTTTLGALTEEEVKGRQLFLLGVRYGRILKRTENFSLFYTVDAIPVALAFHSSVAKGAELISKDVYGLGASPVGFNFRFRTTQQVQPEFGFTGGFLHFEEPVPNPQGTSWNFTATGGCGLRFALPHGRSIALGYMFHHISNGKHPRENPSLNTNLVYFGFAFL